MRRTLMCCVVLTVLGASCSEAETPEAADTTLPPNSCADQDLLECARSTQLADLVPAESTEADDSPLVIGMINQENTAGGSFPELSQATQAGIDFVNEHLGGIDGHPIELDVCNTQFSAEGSTTCGQKFVDAGVPVVMGGIDVFGNGIETLAANKVPFVGGVPVSFASVQSETSFQWSGGSWGAAVAFADHAIQLDAKKVAIIYGDFGSISDSAEYAKSVLDGAGVETQLVPFPILSTDIAPVVNAAVAGEPDAIVILAADASCKPAFQSVLASGTDATVMYTGACAAPPILASVDAEATDGAVFNVEGPINVENPTPDFGLYSEVIARYGKGLDPASVGTVAFRSFMNLYVVLREIGYDALSPVSVIDALSAQVDEQGYMGHDYTCDRKQFEGLPAVCSPHQILAEFRDGTLRQIGDWIDPGAIYSA